MAAFSTGSGGIGPTHDDVTYAAVAKACGTDLSLHQPTVEVGCFDRVPRADIVGLIEVC